MIIKIEDLKCGNQHGWRYVDNVQDIKAYKGYNKDPDGNSIFFMRLELLKDEAILYDTLIINCEQVYLMNDEGKTIERLN